MTYWPWYVGGLALSGVMLLHWVLLQRMMGVSGRITQLVNRLRFGEPTQTADAELSQEQLLAALRAETAAMFGAEALDAVADPPQSPANEADASPEPQPPTRPAAPADWVFFAAVALGGCLSMVLAGSFSPSLTLHSAGFAKLVHGSPVLGTLVLLVGGLLVGFGTRMAGGCTSGHGLCGVSRLQKGSLLATAAFFGMGVVTALLLARLS